MCKLIGWAISCLSMARLGTLVPLNNCFSQPMFTFHSYSAMDNLRRLRPATRNLSSRRSASDTPAVASCSASEIGNCAAENPETCRFLPKLHSFASSGLGINNLCSLYFFQDKTLVIKCLSLSKPRDIEEGTIIGTEGPESNFLKN